MKQILFRQKTIKKQGTQMLTDSSSDSEDDKKENEQKHKNKVLRFKTHPQKKSFDLLEQKPASTQIHNVKLKSLPTTKVLPAKKTCTLS